MTLETPIGNTDATIKGVTDRPYDVVVHITSLEYGESVLRLSPDETLKLARRFSEVCVKRGWGNPTAVIGGKYV